MNIYLAKVEAHFCVGWGRREREQGRRLYLEKENTNCNISEGRVTKGREEVNMHLLSSSVSRSSLDRISLNSLTSTHFQDKDSEAYRNSIPHQGPRADTWRGRVRGSW